MFQKLLEKLALGLQKKGIDSMVIGGQALLIYGEPRLTNDIDVTLGIGPEGFEEIRELAESSGWKILAENPEEFVRKTFVLPCLDSASGIRIDFIFSFSPYERAALKRVKQVQIGKAKVGFASLEDLIIHKIIASRPRDLEDVRSVLYKNPKADFSYIQKWLLEFQEALQQPFLSRFNEIKQREMG